MRQNKNKQTKTCPEKNVNTVGDNFIHFYAEGERKPAQEKLVKTSSEAGLE